MSRNNRHRGIDSESSKQISLSGIEFDNLASRELISKVRENLIEGKGGRIATPNVHFLHLSRKSDDLLGLINSHDFVVCDSQILFGIFRLFRVPIKEKLSGSDLVGHFLNLANDMALNVCFIGGNPEFADRLRERVRSDFPKILGIRIISDFLDNEPNIDALEDVYLKIKADDTHLVFMGLGFPKQELWSQKLIEKLPEAWFLNFGMALNYLEGSFVRSPRVFQLLGLEWLWRLLSEPKRLASRYLLEDLPELVWIFSNFLFKRGKE